MHNYTLYLGDCLQTLRTLPSASVQTCVTSPPYFGLRDYGTAQWQGGSAECDHSGKPMSTRAGFNERYFGRESATGNKQDELREPFKAICGKCGAHRIDSQIGLESTPEAYVAKLVDVFREVWRVLRDDGSLWLNLGDSYNGSGGAGGDYGVGGLKEGQPKYPGRNVNGLKPKDLIGIPWMVAFALRADGWYLRSDIIWHKPNPMPESVTDRPTKAHEYIFLLSKSASYYYDAEAIREPLSPTASYGGTYRTVTKMDDSRNDKGTFNAIGKTILPDPNGRNRRSVWTVTTKPYSGAHFATFPPDLIEPCILAGSRKGDTVLDPFNGSGTTGAVALKHGRAYIGIDLNPDYIELAHDRISKAQPMLLEVSHA
jgi:DNA modification methylase